MSSKFSFMCAHLKTCVCVCAHAQLKRNIGDKLSSSSDGIVRSLALIMIIVVYEYHIVSLVLLVIFFIH